MIVLELDNRRLEAYCRLATIAGYEFFRFVLRNSDLGSVLVLLDETSGDPRIFVGPNVDVVGDGAAPFLTHGEKNLLGEGLDIDLRLK